MRHLIFINFVMLAVSLIPQVANAAPISHLEQRISSVISSQSAQQIAAHFAAKDAHGTPLIIQLARQGNVRGVLQAKEAADGRFLTATDAYGNNVFHAAKNADTVQALASLIRHFYTAQAPQQITALVDARNKLGETPLQAQINAGHADTFLPLYTYSTLKKKNDLSTRQLARLNGANDAIAATNREIYCKEMLRLSSTAGRTLLQAARDQIPYHPQMAHVARIISQEMPCLAN